MKFFVCGHHVGSPRMNCSWFNDLIKLSNLFQGNSRGVDKMSNVPHNISTHPQLGTIGMNHFHVKLNLR